MLLAGTAFAGDWTKPTLPAAQTLEENMQCYLLNVGSESFFTGTQVWYSWNTSTGVDAVGQLSVLAPSTSVDGAWFICRASDNKHTFISAVMGGANNAGRFEMHVDMAAQGHDSWEIIADGSDYKIRIAESDAIYGIDAYPETWATSFVGWLGKEHEFANAVYGNVTAEDVAAGGSNVWRLVSVEDHDSYVSANACYVAAQALKAAIDEAKAQFPDLDLAAEEAVYNNTESTLEELEAAKASVEAKLAKAIADAAAGSATVDNPSDLSNLIVNSTFDKIGDFTGWSSGFGAGGATDACAECYDKTFDVHQDIQNLPNGVYMLSVDGFHRMGGHAESLAAFKKGTPSDAYVYASNAIEAVDTLKAEIMNNFQGIEPGDNSLGGMAFVDGDYTYYVPNSMQDAVKFFEGGKYNGNSVMFAVTDGVAKIGVKKSVHRGTDWVIVDNFKLTYYGGAAEAYQMWMDQFIAGQPTYANVEYVTTSVMEAYKAALEANKTATTNDEVVANIKAIKAAQAEVAANIAAWILLDEAVSRAMEVIGSGDIAGADVEALADYLEFEVPEYFAALELTTEEILAEVEKINKMREDAIANGLTPGADFTSQLVNPSFSTGDWTGWTREAASGGNVAVNATAKCAEAWNNSNFDIYQVVEGAPTGVYEISMQGFYREGRGEAAWNLYFDEYGDVRADRPVSTAFVYMNDAKTPIANVFDYQVETGELYTTTGDLAPYTDPLGVYWYPNDMLAAGEAFAQGAYQVSAFGLVADGAPMRLGVKGRSNNLGDSWAIFDNFKLTFQGFKAEIIQPILEEQVALISTDGVFGADVKEEAAAVIAEAQAALQNGDGRAMFEALNKVYKLVDAVENSKALFVKLEEALDAFQTAISESEAAETVKAEALAYYTQVKGAYTGYTNAEAEAALEKIAELTTALAIPANAAEASDEHPVDLTSVLQSPSFENDGTNSIEGWTYTSMPGGITGGQKEALAAEYYQATYDIYQDVVGLPNGTYKVSVNAFYRNGSTDQDFQSVEEGTEGLAKMYAQTAEGLYQKSVCLLASGAVTEQVGVGNELTHTYEDGTVVYIPNDMNSAAAYFEMGQYLNKLYVKVSDGKLRIGMKQDESITYGWMIMDNWTLTYYGANSNQELSGIDMIENAAKAANVEFFNLNGQKVNGLQQGVCIVRTTLANGQVVVRKISVK